MHAAKKEVHAEVGHEDGEERQQYVGVEETRTLELRERYQRKPQMEYSPFRRFHEGC